jgi:hypothetical protein
MFIIETSGSEDLLVDLVGRLAGIPHPPEIQPVAGLVDLEVRGAPQDLEEREEERRPVEVVVGILRGAIRRDPVQVRDHDPQDRIAAESQPRVGEAVDQEDAELLAELLEQRAVVQGGHQLLPPEGLKS